LLKIGHILYTLICFFVAAAVCHAAAPIKINVQPCFFGMRAGNVYPLVITIENSGRSASGTIQVKADSYSQQNHIYNYPIDLPSGTSKQLIAYPIAKLGISGFEVSFSGPVDVKPAEFSIRPYSDSTAHMSVGMISDEPGAFQSIRATDDNAPTGPTSPVCDSYCVPENAPDRAAGYDGLDELVIGAGAERMSDDQWSAIREWISSGGSLLLLGGAGSLTYLSTPTGAMLSPLTNIHQNIAASIHFPKNYGAEQYQNVAIVNGAVKPGAAVQLAQGTSPLMVSKFYGVGQVTLVSFDPMAQPIHLLSGAPGLLSSIVYYAKDHVDTSTMSGWYNQTPSSDLSDSNSAAANPFKIQLPAFSKVAWIFVLYFVLVIPVTYFVLRRIGKLELTWVSTPIISVIFAFVFYFYTSDLYKAAMSHRTSGVVTIASDGSGGRFVGLSELFIPHGGSYDIPIPGADCLEINQLSNAYDYSGSSDILETVDTLDGEAANNFPVGNLAFKRFYFTQAVNSPGTINAHLTQTPAGVNGNIANNTSLPLTNVTVTNTGSWHSYSIGTINPGQTITVHVKNGTALPAILGFEGLNKKPGPDNDSVFLQALVPGKYFGIQTGNDVSGAKSVTLLTTLPVTVEHIVR
jgi:hypothetical protein